MRSDVSALRLAATHDGITGPGAAHFVVLSSDVSQIEDDAAKLVAMHPGAVVSGGGAKRVFLDIDPGQEDPDARTDTVAIGFQCVQVTSILILALDLTQC